MAMLYLRNKPIGAISDGGGGGGTYTEGDGIDITNNEISVDTAFTEASTRANISSGDSFSTILGKIKKFFTDLKTVAFSGSYNDLSNKPTIPTDFVSKAYGGRFGGSIVIDRQDGTSSAEGVSQLWLGNGAAIGSNGNSHGEIIFYRGQYFNVLVSDSLTNNHYIFLPNNGGTIALTSDITSTLLLNYATPFYMPGAQGTKIRFTFTGLSNYESIHLLIFGRYSSADILAVCSSTGFSSIKTSPITADSTYNMGTAYVPNNGYTFTVQVGAWSAAWGIFIHPGYPNATMTMTRET